MCAHVVFILLLFFLSSQVFPDHPLPLSLPCLPCTQTFCPLALCTFPFIVFAGLSERQRCSGAALLPCFSPGLFPRVVPRNAPHQSRLPHLSTPSFSPRAPPPPTSRRSLPVPAPPPAAISRSHRPARRGKRAVQPKVQAAPTPAVEQSLSALVRVLLVLRRCAHSPHHHCYDYHQCQHWQHRQHNVQKGTQNVQSQVQNSVFGEEVDVRFFVVVVVVLVAVCAPTVETDAPGCKPQEASRFAFNLDVELLPGAIFWPCPDCRSHCRCWRCYGMFFSDLRLLCSIRVRELLDDVRCFCSLTIFCLCHRSLFLCARSH